jgi:hypothetical protein
MLHLIKYENDSWICRISNPDLFLIILETNNSSSRQVNEIVFRLKYAVSVNSFFAHLHSINLIFISLFEFLMYHSNTLYLLFMYLHIYFIFLTVLHVYVIVKFVVIVSVEKVKC